MIMKTTSRFERVIKKEVPRDYDAFLYRIDVLESGSDIWKYYIGWHSGHIEDVEMHRYLHSSRNQELDAALETADSIIYNFLDFGTKIDMATLEAKMLSEVNAVSNSLYYNKSNGGGKHCHIPKSDYDLANAIFDKIQNGSYIKNFYSKSTLKKMLNENKKIQVRVQEFDPFHVRVLRDKMEGKTAADFDPIHVLMPENDEELPVIIGGNHSTIGATGSKTMNGLYAIEIPYNDWHKLEYTDLQYLGMLLNPEDEKPRKTNSLEDIAKWVVATIEEKGLYKNANQLPFAEPEPWFNSSIIANALIKMGLSANQRGRVTSLAKDDWKRKELFKSGSNFIDFSDLGLSENPRLNLWLKNHKNHLMNSKNLDMIVKISSGQHIWSQIEKVIIKHDPNTGKILDHPKKIHVLIYFTKLDYEESTAWKKSYEVWNYTYKKFFSNDLEITHELLPTTSDKINLPELPEDYENGHWND